MGDSYPKVMVAAVQAAPIFLDRESTVAKACQIIRDAGRRGARVIAFPEGFIPTHPLWYYFHPATSARSSRFATRLFENAVEVPSPATDAIGEAARDAGAYVVMGVCERRHGTLGTMFNTQVFFAPDGHILGKHQKLTPTGPERLVHMAGAADTLSVYKTGFGGLSGLICAENNNPLITFAMMAENTTIHVSAWPPVGSQGSLLRADRALVTGRAFAFAAQAFVINSVGVVSDEMRTSLASSEADSAYLADRRITGGSSIIAPDGAVLAGPLGPEEETLYAEVDIEQCVVQKIRHDMAGHYNRADVFTLTVNDRPQVLYARRDSRGELATGRPNGTGDDVAPQGYAEAPVDQRSETGLGIDGMVATPDGPSA